MIFYMGTDLGKRTIGYCCSPDMRDPWTLLKHVQLATQAGFKAIWVSDHFHPFFDTNAHEYSTLVWMSAALERVKQIPFGTSVIAPILRYHPAIIAQAFGTMELMFGRRVILGVGSGEALNEVPLGFRWPSPKERREMLVEAVGIIRKLWTGDFVSFSGKYYTLSKAKLYMSSSVPIYISAYGPRTAELVGMIGDGFITEKPLDYVERSLFPQLRKGAISVGRTIDQITKVLDFNVSYGSDYEKALDSVRSWGGGFFPSTFISPVCDPRELEAMSKTISDETLANTYLVGDSIEEHIRRIENAFKIGFDHVQVFNASSAEESFIEAYRNKIIPYFHDGKN